MFRQLDLRLVCQDRADFHTDDYDSKVKMLSFNTDLRKILLLACFWLTPLASGTEQNKPNVKTFVVSFKLHKEFLFKRETDGCFGWEKDKQCNDHPVAAFPIRRYRNRRLSLCPHKNLSSTQPEQKASPDEENAEV